MLVRKGLYQASDKGVLKSKFLYQEDRMKILYLVYVAGHGRGGHIYSLLETATQLSKEVDTIIVSIGSNRSPVLESFGEKYIHFENQGLMTTIGRLYSFIREEGITLLHAFDVKAFFYARLLSIRS